MRRVLLGIVAGVMSVATASAQISNIVYDVVATNSIGTATFQGTFGEGGFVAGVYQWNSGGIVPLFDGGGNLIAQIQGNTTIWPDLANGGYQIRYGFQVVAGERDTTFTITSARLGFAALNNPDGRATMQGTLTDQTGDGALFSADIGGKTSQSLYNGATPGTGTVFANLMGGISVVSPGGSQGNNEAFPAVGFTPIAGVVNSMTGMLKFTVSAGDLASGTAQFTIVPEPATLALLALGALGLIRRR